MSRFLVCAWPHTPTMTVLLEALTTLRAERATGGCGRDRGAAAARANDSQSTSASGGGRGGVPAAGRSGSLPPPLGPAAVDAALQTQASAGGVRQAADGTITSPFAFSVSG